MTKLTIEELYNKDTTEKFSILYFPRLDVENNERWKEWIDHIPYIKFPADWKVQIVPPFRGALIRFRVKHSSDYVISVFLDVYDRLGYEDGPYWEVYPYQYGFARFPLTDVEGML